MDWIHLAWDREAWWDFGTTRMSQGSKKSEEFLD
jgi:hypothetical protein